MKDQNTEIRKSVNQLKKLFKYKPSLSEIIPESDRVGYMDRSNVIMIIPKNYFLKNIITQDFDVTEQKVPELDYSKNPGGCNFSVEFLNLIIPLLKNTISDKVHIQTNKDYPITLETDEVKIIFAPRND